MRTDKILPTGSSGLMGTNLTNEHRKEGHETYAADLQNNECDDIRRGNLRDNGQRFFERHNFEYTYHPATEYGCWDVEKMFPSSIEKAWRFGVSRPPTDFEYGLKMTQAAFVNNWDDAQKGA